MLKKTILALILCALFLNAQETDQTIDEKFAACEQTFDECVYKCDENKVNYEECVGKCDENLYKCNSIIQDLEDNPEGK